MDLEKMEERINQLEARVLERFSDHLDLLGRLAESVEALSQQNRLPNQMLDLANARIDLCQKRIDILSQNNPVHIADTNTTSQSGAQAVGVPSPGPELFDFP